MEQTETIGKISNTGSWVVTKMNKPDEPAEWLRKKTKESENQLPTLAQRKRLLLTL